MKTKKVTVMAMCIALAMILSYLESLIPSPGIPGVKLGLAGLHCRLSGVWLKLLASVVTPPSAI